MTTIGSQITSLTVVYSIVYSGADQRKHQSSASLAFLREIHRDRWIPRTKDQLRGKCFHLMTSSWYYGDPSWHGHFGQINSSPPWTKWPPFRGRYFHMHFREFWLKFSLNFCSYVSNWQYPSMGLDNGLVPNKRQAIVWANADPIHWRIYAAIGGDVLRHKVWEWLIRETWPRLIFLNNPIFRTQYRIMGRVECIYGVIWPWYEGNWLLVVPRWCFNLKWQRSSSLQLSTLCTLSKCDTDSLYL